MILQSSDLLMVSPMEQFVLYGELSVLEKQGRDRKWCAPVDTPHMAKSKAGRPARTYIQQLCDDTGCNPEDLPEAMNDRETWKERVRDIRASRTTWWWWVSELNYYFIFVFFQNVLFCSLFLNISIVWSRMKFGLSLVIWIVLYLFQTL